MLGGFMLPCAILLCVLGESTCSACVIFACVGKDHGHDSLSTVLRPLEFSLISPEVLYVVSPPISVHHTDSLLSHSLGCTVWGDIPVDTYAYTYIQKHMCKVYCMFFLIPVQVLMTTTLLLSIKKFVRIHAYSLYQLIEAVKRVSLRGLVTQSYPNACQHCHVI